MILFGKHLKKIMRRSQFQNSPAFCAIKRSFVERMFRQLRNRLDGLYEPFLTLLTRKDQLDAHIEYHVLRRKASARALRRQEKRLNSNSRS